MPTFSAPTARFPSALRITALDAGDVVVRVHQKIHSAVFFGPPPGASPQGRFDAPAGQYRLLYAAQRLEGAFVETVLRRPANRIVRRAFVEERMWTPLRLLEGAGHGNQFREAEELEIGFENSSRRSHVGQQIRILRIQSTCR
ncbi:RES domain-containing protein (plasmid) [Rhizobium sp. CB3171]|uniref:RES domain-containing protein n=1 Tax=Rhizobium sp. CB3171 TaxID=3039157 RepID=UPI0024B18D7A|nr:RES domain-containing protein [Rhizobium sp. CB3171]WFU06813.1 RES domain-containing protein [Rhizobium sp. CB3171]